jgi:hypothetical protein
VTGDGPISGGRKAPPASRRCSTRPRRATPGGRPRPSAPYGHSSSRPARSRSPASVARHGSSSRAPPASALPTPTARPRSEALLPFPPHDRDPLCQRESRIQPSAKGLRERRFAGWHEAPPSRQLPARGRAASRRTRSAQAARRHPARSARDVEAAARAGHRRLPVRKAMPGPAAPGIETCTTVAPAPVGGFAGPAPVDPRPPGSLHRRPGVVVGDRDPRCAGRSPSPPPSSQVPRGDPGSHRDTAPRGADARRRPSSRATGCRCRSSPGE